LRRASFIGVSPGRPDLRGTRAFSRSQTVLCNLSHSDIQLECIRRPFVMNVNAKDWTNERERIDQ